MPSNQTPNYRLSQWERTDRVLMEDFNGDNAKIDAALAALKAQADSQQSAVAQHGSSIARLGNCAVSLTTYRGNGANTRTLSFSGYPMAVWIQEADSPVNELHMIRGAAYVAGIMGAATVSLAWTSRGVTWTYSKPDTVKMNDSNRQYTVVALLDMSK